MPVYVCICLGVTDNQISKAIVEDGKTVVDGIKATTGAGGCCGSCVPIIESILKEHMEKAPLPLPVLDTLASLLPFASLGGKINEKISEGIKIAPDTPCFPPIKKIIKK